MYTSSCSLSKIGLSSLGLQHLAEMLKVNTTLEILRYYYIIDMIKFHTYSITTIIYNYSTAGLAETVLLLGTAEFLQR